MSSDEDVVQAYLDGSKLTLRAGTAGHAEVAVGDVVIPVTVEENYGEAYDFSSTDCQLTPEGRSKELKI